MKELKIEFDYLTPELLQNLDRKEDFWIYIKILKKFIPDLKKQTESYDEIYEVMAANPNTPLEQLNILKDFENEEVRMNLALNPKITPIMIEKLSNDESPYVRMSLLNRKDLNEEIMEKLFHDNGKYTENTHEYDDEYYSDEEYNRYYNDEEEEEINDTDSLRKALDELENIANELKFLEEEGAETEDEYEAKRNIDEIHFLIASNPEAPLNLLNLLSNNPNEEIRIKVAQNPKTDFMLLKKLAQDGSDEVKAAILKRNDGNLKIKLVIKNHTEWIYR